LVAVSGADEAACVWAFTLALILVPASVNRDLFDPNRSVERTSEK